MNWAGPEFVLSIVAISTAGWLINNWVRARHGYALEDEWGGKTPRADDEAIGKLRTENANLREQLDRAHDRLANVERIVTDSGFDVSRQIDALREGRTQ
ncbi:hypothetical protein [Novosphingobium olei]|uniref:hypothetical protein n=1 Tax=Novosphingobium olei TaxID=2728851 RepID=UPI00308F9453|nr:hypothetical protein NSDW_07710 [Novosphingobium olei]